MNVPIKEVKFSMEHYHGHPALVILFGGSSKREIQDLFAYVLASKDIIEAVVFDGDEPTDYPSALTSLCTLFKQEGLLTKVITQGSNSTIIKDLISRRLIDSLSLIIYAPLDSIRIWDWVVNNPEAQIFHIYQILEYASRSHIDIKVLIPIIDGINNRADVIRSIAESISKFDPTVVLMDGEGEISREEMRRLAKSAKGIVPEVRIRTAEYGEEGV
ncbi:MAG: hypothetical protein J7K68_00850 [Candidatus Diapherotrites archaeon]|nr:hypothetical protein [Candidatus Diapherotrites archaeon]